MQARWGTHGDHPIIVLCPRGVRETYDLTVRAFNLCEIYRTPVVLIFDEITGHVNERVVLPTTVRVADRVRPETVGGTYKPFAHTPTDVPPMVSFGQGHRFNVTGLAHDETGFPTNDSKEIDKLLRRLNRKIVRYADKIVQVDRDLAEGAGVAVVSYGSTARSARQAIRMARGEGIAVSALSLLTLWPFPEQAVAELGKRHRDIIVPEMNLGQIAHEVEWAVGREARVHSLSRIDGEPIHPEQILERIREVNGNGRP
jgi:2-oxoglutarate ferredoxin oxidoreductase subunit alpha